MSNEGNVSDVNNELRAKILATIDKASYLVLGQRRLLESIIAAITLEGHLLIEGAPGLGKTLSVSTLSKLCALKFKRVQFTPDLLPSDLLGTMIYNQTAEDFKVKLGPIFTQILLADEINRAPPKVQSALLEAMEENQVTIGEETHLLETPFVVLATQNPIEQEGTYPLPEAQIDRFMMKINVSYPDFESEKKILLLNKKILLQELSSSLEMSDLLTLKDAVNAIYVDEKIKELIVKIVQATRPDSSYFQMEYKDIIINGASPRASIWLYKVSKFFAFLQGKDFVAPEDVLNAVPEVVGHRIILSYSASIDQIKPKDVVLKIAQSLI
ncbi:MAG: AAA family ATPase [Oligoflexia bacterium]|nr:AAA family ATPase [Oligoflexia bacterium]